ncbi:endonuclease/exonuclease/phosphatase family protein [Galbibacter sp.]|jgi:endonuclease/exonuclease/phosphatase (EEP) superfamily protein YafD|uniref:endonuclease/exonuclease/phosphatase family protein n=1 Tax=Galbibacter sp. TaxID=2918471 RepID=UPI003A909B78
MWTTYLIMSGILISSSIFPYFPSRHWVFRVCSFGKLQIAFLILLTLGSGFLFVNPPGIFWFVQGALLVTLIDHLATLLKYTPAYPRKKVNPTRNASEKITLISANVYQFNKDFKRFISLIRNHKPDIFLTMESNKDWEQALRELESDYPYNHKVTLENTYGIHLYSRIAIEKSKTHFFVADDLPSIEAHMKTCDGYRFVFFGLHPPPPSPTEEETSKERDGDLLSAAKRIKELRKTTMVVGDFNNVAWSKSSNLFRKTSELIDPRVGYGFVSTFHAKYKLLRFPIDLMFHSKEIFIQQLKTLHNFGSDHLPVYCEFYIDRGNNSQKEEVEKAFMEEKEEAEKIIVEGKKEEGDRDVVAKK